MDPVSARASVTYRGCMGAIVSAIAASCLLAAGRVPAVDAPDAVGQALREELDRIGGARTPHKKEKVKLADATVEVVPFEIGREFQPSAEELPASVRNVTVQGGNFCRAGRPEFLIGVEARMHNGGWLLKTLGIDFEEYHVTPATMFRHALEVSKAAGPDGKTRLTVKVAHGDPWGEARIRETLRAGALYTYDYHLTMQNFWPLPHLEYRFRPEFYTPHLDGWRKCSSHFLDLNLENQQARQLVVNLLRYGCQYTRKHPVLLREIANEVCYINPSAENIAAFQAAMAKKYVSIEKANAAWRTAFGDFARVVPPINVEGCCIYNSEWGVVPSGRDLSASLWVDWIKFMQANGMARFAELVAEYKANDPKAVCTFQTPYWTGLHAQTPASIGKVSDVYGQEAGLALIKVEKGKEDWNSIRSMLEQGLSFDLAAGANPDKPIVNLECCCLGYPKGEYPIGPAGMRAFFWNQAVHGGGGSVISYFYSQATSEGGSSVWDPARMRIGAVRELPRIKAELRGGAVGGRPWPRIPGGAAMLFSHESCRVLRREDGDRYAKVVPEICDFYGAALFTGVPLDVLDNERLLREEIGMYAAVVLPRAVRVLPGTIEKLAKYVEAGGTLVVSCDSLKTDDDRHTPLDAAPLLGGRPGAAVTKGERVTFEAGGLPECDTVGLSAAPADGVDDFTQPVFGFRFEPASAKTIAKAGGEPAMTVNEIGRGRVYYLAREFGGQALCKVMAWIFRQAGETPDATVEFSDGLGTSYVETHLLQRERRGNAVLYAMNWGGGPRPARIKVLRDLGGGNCTVRNFRTGETVRPPDGAEWTQELLATQGIPCDLPMHDPVLFAIHNATKAPLPSPSLTPDQTDALSWLWRTSPFSEKRILFDAYYTAEGHIHGYKMPTAAKRLEDRGYQVEYLCDSARNPRVRNGDEVRKAELSNFGVLVISGAHGRDLFEDPDVSRILRFVEEGGGLLYCTLRDWHSSPQQRLLDRIGVKVGFSYFRDEENCVAGEPMWIEMTDIAPHPATKGVSKVLCMGGRPLAGAGTALVRSGPKSHTAHTWGDARKDGPQALIHALEIGKGRAVVVGTDVLFRPDDLESADNKRLFDSIIDWLAEPSAGRTGRRE